MTEAMMKDTNERQEELLVLLLKLDVVVFTDSSGNWSLNIHQLKKMRTDKTHVILLRVVLR
jgi:hypothetical protein